MDAVIYQEDLAGATCDEPGCTCDSSDGIYLVANCHPQGGVEVFYNKHTGCLEIECSICQKQVGVVRVAKRTQGMSDN